MMADAAIAKLECLRTMVACCDQPLYVEIIDEVLREIRPALDPDAWMEDWRKAHDAFCLAAGFCFTPGSKDCATRSRMAGLKVCQQYLPEQSA